MIRRYSLRTSCPEPATEETDSDLLWYDLEQPTPEECQDICKKLRIPPEHIQAALDINERPRLEQSQNVLLLVVRAPVLHSSKGHIAFATRPIGIILTERALVTVCLEPGMLQKLLYRTMAGSGSHMAERLVLTLLLRIDGVFIDHLHLMDKHMEHLERSLQKSLQNKELLDVLHIEKSLVYFLTALKGNQGVLERLRNNALFSQHPEIFALLDDVFIEHRQAMDMAEIFTQIMGSLSDVFGGMVSNNLNKVMKVLTSLTMVFMIPSVIGALYGMNVALPGADSPYAFLALCALCLGLCFGAYRILRRMDWM